MVRERLGVTVHTWWVRKVLYRLGFRPKYPSIFYSPSLSYLYSYRDYVKKHTNLS